MAPYNTLYVSIMEKYIIHQYWSVPFLWHKNLNSYALWANLKVACMLGTLRARPGELNWLMLTLSILLSKTPFDFWFDTALLEMIVCVCIMPVWQIVHEFHFSTGSSDDFKGFARTMEGLHWLARRNWGWGQNSNLLWLPHLGAPCLG